jgi:class 3 adenylate cyclase
MGFASLLAGQLRQRSVYLLGTADEGVGLFGSPAPNLPPGDVDAAGVERIAVEPCVQLREAFARWLGGVARSLQQRHSVMPGPGSPQEAAERAYFDILRETLVTVAAADRRQGLANLFWLAHSREIAEEMDKCFAGPDAHSRLRYQVHPLLCGIMRRADEASRCASGRPQRAIHDFRRGESWNDSIVRTVVEDQLALTETNPGAFVPSQVLTPGNGRFRIDAAAFEEICEILREQFAALVGRGDPGIGALLQRLGGAVLPAAGDAPQAWDRFVFADPVRRYLLHDLDGTVARLLHSRTLRRALSNDRSWNDVLDDFTEVTRCVRRAETVHLLRNALDFLTRGVEQQETRERYLEGRLFRFGPREVVQSGVRTTTILFADIRGFTRASEGAVSEGDLARELYEIFDPAAIIVQRFDGTMDKYLGDGFMATFTGGSRPGEEALAAVRAATSLQQVLGRMRLLGRTSFRLGISLHTGRVAVARFLIDQQHAATTIIGRQVNIAGRLSASEGDLATARTTPGAKVVGDVAIDGAGHLINHGIAVSGPLIEGLRRQLAFEPFREEGIEGLRAYDQERGQWLHFGYVGEVRFRGIEAAIPVYSLGFHLATKEAAV